MTQVHMTEAELARDLHAVLEKVQGGAEIIVEHDARAVAVLKAPAFRGRPIEECIASAKAHGSHTTLDDLSGNDLEDIIGSRRAPLSPPAWD